MTPHRARFTVHSFDIDAFHTLSLQALAGYLQEVAGRHADELGCGLDSLRSRGLTWVLMRQRLEVPVPIMLGEEVEVTTWPSGIDRILVSREFVVTRAGTEVACSSSAWLLVDLETRRPIRPADVLDPALRPQRQVVAPIPKRLPQPEVPDPAAADPAAADPTAAALERTFQVRFQDIDANQHVNNASYLGWALETITAHRWRAQRPSAMEVHFLAESRLGDAVVSRASGRGDELLHAIVRQADARELARLRTRWVPRESGRTIAGRTA